MHRGRQHLDALGQEADAKAESMKLQLGAAEGDLRLRIENRMKRVKGAYHARGVKLAQAWSLAKEAVAA